MNHGIKANGKKRVTALFLSLALAFSTISAPAFAAQEDAYHDPAEHWLSAANRTNELDVNATVTHETGNCAVCGKSTTFLIYRTPEYTRNGESAMTRNVRYSDGTLMDGEGTGAVMDGTPGKDAYYTGCHWTKACCDTCGTINSNMGIWDYCFGKNVYWLYDCAAEFTEELPEQVTYEYADSTYHSKITTGGSYCCFCFGTHHTGSSELERHRLRTEIVPQSGNHRFAIVERCEDCEYEKTEYVAAKSVVADYYGAVDGQPHTVTISDLSETGVSTQIRYGSSADACTLTSAPNYTEKGQYAVYYQIDYTYQGVTMTENGVAYVWLRDETTATEKHSSCGEQHNFVALETVNPTCKALGYTRYLCVECGKIEKRDYVNAIGHAWQSILIRDASCEAGGKALNICKNCGECQEIVTPKSEHQYSVSTVNATCVSPGYTVKECEVCGERHITDMENAKPHRYEAITTPASCEGGGYTLHLCKGCGSSFITDYTEPLGHCFDQGTTVTSPSCTGEGVTEYRCVRCGYHYLDGNGASGHSPGEEATCTTSQLCTVCGAVLKKALGHSYQAEVILPTCTEMGFTTYTCKRCGESYKSDYVKETGHKESDWIVDQEPTTQQEGSRHKECETCGKVLTTENIEKLYLTATTDSRGEAVVGGYLVIVTDTDTKNPVANAQVVLNQDGSLSIRLPDGRIIDYADQTTVTVLLTKDKTPVAQLPIAVTDRNGNDTAGKTDQAGQMTVPTGSGMTNDDGKATVGGEDADGERYTMTVRVIDFETGRPIEGAVVTVGKTGNITVRLPDGTDMDENNRVTVLVTDQNKKPLQDKNVTIKGDLGQSASGQTDEKGELTLPDVVKEERHGVYIYGYGDGTFGPERNMARCEAAAIFARLLAEKKGDRIPENGTVATKYTDIPSDAWYAGYVKYLTNYGVAYGRGDNIFAPNDAITRGEFTVMAVRFFEVYGEGAEEIVEKYEGFSDVSSGYWAAEYIKDAAMYGWVYGCGDGNFHAEDNITRAEVVSLMNRMLGRTADEAYIAKNLRTLNTFSDLSDRHWAYLAVMEAANAHTAILGETETWSK